MTELEAIEELKNGEWWDLIGDISCDTNASVKFRKALGMAIAALRAQQEANFPLTLEELREMDGDKIYIHYIDGIYVDEDGAYFGKFGQLVREYDGRLTACELPLEFYGKIMLEQRIGGVE